MVGSASILTRSAATRLGMDCPARWCVAVGRGDATDDPRDTAGHGRTRGPRPWSPRVWSRGPVRAAGEARARRCAAVPDHRPHLNQGALGGVVAGDGWAVDPWGRMGAAGQLNRSAWGA